MRSASLFVGFPVDVRMSGVVFVVSALIGRNVYRALAARFLCLPLDSPPIPRLLTENMGRVYPTELPKYSLPVRRNLFSHNACRRNENLPAVNAPKVDVQRVLSAVFTRQTF